MTCNYGTTCGPATAIAEPNILNPVPALSSLSAPHTDTTPFQITAANNVILGYGPSNVCLDCSVNNAASSSFASTISIQQNKLDCSNFLQVNDSPAPLPSIQISYLYSGAALTKDYNYFFKTSAITDCAVLGCNIGDTCGSSTISELSI